MMDWDTLKAACAQCHNCTLGETRHNVVFGVGDEHAEVMFIGEGPGENEDLQGEPFVGAAGHLLDDMLEIIGLHRSQVYIANIVKCRPGRPDPTENHRMPGPYRRHAADPLQFQNYPGARPMDGKGRRADDGYLSPLRPAAGP